MALQRGQNVQSPCSGRGRGMNEGQKTAPVAGNVGKGVQDSLLSRILRSSKHGSEVIRLTRYQFGCSEDNG